MSPYRKSPGIVVGDLYDADGVRVGETERLVDDAVTFVADREALLGRVELRRDDGLVSRVAVDPPVAGVRINPGDTVRITLTEIRWAASA